MTSEQDPEKNISLENLDEEEYEYIYGTEDGIYSQSETTHMGEEAEEAAEDQFSYLGEASDDPEQKRRFMEYLSLIKEIECQNQMVEDIKAKIMELCAKPCKTKCEMKDIKRLRVCMEQELIKLQCLMTKAMELQNFGSRRRYPGIAIATTIDEDNMTPYAGCTHPQIQNNWKRNESSDDADKGVCEEQKDSKEQKALRGLCKALGKMKICCPEDRKLVQEIACALLGHKKKKNAQSSPPCMPSLPPCQGPCPPFAKTSKKSKPRLYSSDSMPGADSLERLKQKITCMQSSVGQLKQEIYRRERQKQQPCYGVTEEKEDICSEEPDPIGVCLGKRTAKADEMARLRENYLHLLSEFTKKDCQLKEMEKRLKGFCGSCNDGSGRGEGRSADQSELIVLRQRVADMKEEQVEFKCLMKEQSQQLEEYRNKYLVAQQKVEEQSVTLEKLNMNNKRIEKQINTEVKEIRAKFQEKLNELLHFPKLLENEQLKLAQACKEKEDLQGKLMLVCKELKALKAQVEAPKDDVDCRPKLLKCQMELEQCKTRLEEMERQRDLFCEQLKTTQDDFDTLRSESAKIIARTKERAEATRCQMQGQIDRLEKELAQCRATACLSVSDREAVIREMQGQLNTLSYSFDAAQKQIKTLRNHIAYVSNENCFPVKC
ncbi:PREDICTED: axoneme-associated protein mst101(2) [Rhagoletis zephyria]|uniref:axoneme-associated protein mst101(2) n=1 Tax=Rhagoletis zephyria TaxID=28612 RepID=UPI0008112D38|nr:PREDICTED: axoneme-associated protein mst101(2) [Rhagoletis zephyria]